MTHSQRDVHGIFVNLNICWPSLSEMLIGIWCVYVCVFIGFFKKTSSSFFFLQEMGFYYFLKRIFEEGGAWQFPSFSCGCGGLLSTRGDVVCNKDIKRKWIDSCVRFISIHGGVFCCHRVVVYLDGEMKSMYHVSMHRQEILAFEW